MKRVLRFFPILFALVFVIAAPAAAQTQQQMTADAVRRYKRSDTALNAAYRAAMVRAKEADTDRAAGRGPRANPGFQNALLAAQRAWLAFRDAECLNRGYSYFGGTMQSLTTITCKDELTGQRTRQLQPRAEGE